MKPETEQLLEKTRQKLFDSEEFQASRDLIRWTIPNSGEPDDLDILLDRVERYTPTMKQWVDSFDNPVTQNAEQ
jgi:hypothetical protein